MYKNGYYVEKNEKEAFYIYNRCVETLDEVSRDICGADVYMRLADCYAKGIGTEVEEMQAYILYQKACQLYIVRIIDGDFMVKRSYRHCVETENQLREKMEKEFPEWAGF